MFAAAACQDELPAPVEPDQQIPELSGEEFQTVTFSVAVPEDAHTKAISDGLMATNLEYAVYRSEAYIAEDGTEYPAGEYLPVLSQGQNAKIEKDGERKWTATLTLAKNVKYDIVFWAYAEGAPYTFEEENAKIVVNNYTDAANDEVRDAFFGRCDEYAVVTNDTKVELRRPFAQINFASDDYVPYVTDLHLDVTSKIDTDYHAAEEATKYDAARPAVAQTELPTVLNVLDGSVSDYEVVNFALGKTPYDGGDQVLLEVDNGSGVKIPYYWVSMNYVLAAESENTIDNVRATFHYNGEDLKIDVPNVPYKRNYRTNILGTLFTGPARFNVIIVPDYYTPDTIINLWDGVTVTEPSVEDDEYIITTGAELAWVAQQVNAGNDFAGKKVLIASDIRLADCEWTPIGTDEHPFRGTIEALAVTSMLTKSGAAEYYTISGLNVDYTAGPAGLVGVLEGEAINISLYNPVVKGAEYVGAVAGKIFTAGEVNGARIEKGTVTGNHFVGGVVGYAYGSVKNSVVEGLDVNGVYVNDDLDGNKIGGILGFLPLDVAETDVVSGNVVKSLDIKGHKDVAAVVGAAKAANVVGNTVETAVIEAKKTETAGVIVGTAYGENDEVVVLDPEANTYYYEEITVNGEQAKQPEPEQPEPEQPADPWVGENVVSYEMPEYMFTDYPQYCALTELKAYADETNVYARLKTTKGSGVAKLRLCTADTNEGTETIWYWEKSFYSTPIYKSDKASVDVDFNFSLTYNGSPVALNTVVDGDVVYWEMTIPRTAHEHTSAAGAVNIGFVSYDAVGSENGMMPKVWGEMLKVTLP